MIKQMQQMSTTDKSGRRIFWSSLTILQLLSIFKIILKAKLKKKKKGTSLLAAPGHTDLTTTFSWHSIPQGPSPKWERLTTHTSKVHRIQLACKVTHFCSSLSAPFPRTRTSCLLPTLGFSKPPDPNLTQPWHSPASRPVKWPPALPRPQPPFYLKTNIKVLSFPRNRIWILFLSKWLPRSTQLEFVHLTLPFQSRCLSLCIAYLPSALHEKSYLCLLPRRWGLCRGWW